MTVYLLHLIFDKAAQKAGITKNNRETAKKLSYGKWFENVNCQTQNSNTPKTDLRMQYCKTLKNYKQSKRNYMKYPYKIEKLGLSIFKTLKKLHNYETVFKQTELFTQRRGVRLQPESNTIQHLAYINELSVHLEQCAAPGLTLRDRGQIPLLHQEVSAWQ